MLLHPFDAAYDEAEWRDWLAAGRDFGQLIGVGDEWPVVIPTHFALMDRTVLVHLDAHNPIWPSIRKHGRALLSVVDDEAYIPSYWRVADQADESAGVPTSYYATVQMRCTATVVDDPAEKAELVGKQLEILQPEGRYAVPALGGAHHGLLRGITGLRLDIVDVRAKFKFDDHKPEALRRAISERLDTRATGRDLSAAAEQRRRVERGQRQP